MITIEEICKNIKWS